MHRRFPMQVTLVALGLVSGLSAATNYSGNLRLSDEDLDQIRDQLTRHYPELSSSPGLHAVDARAGKDPGTPDRAVLYYLPHSEAAGIRQALQATCHRRAASPCFDDGVKNAWQCGKVIIRQLVQLQGQNYDARVSGDFGYAEVSALHQATLEVFRASPLPVPETLIKLGRDELSGEVWMVWGSDKGIPDSHASAVLEDGADPGLVDSWTVRVGEIAPDGEMLPTWPPSS